MKKYNIFFLVSLFGLGLTYPLNAQEKAATMTTVKGENNPEVIAKALLTNKSRTPPSDIKVAPVTMACSTEMCCFSPMPAGWVGIAQCLVNPTSPHTP